MAWLRRSSSSSTASRGRNRRGMRNPSLSMTSTSPIATPGDTAIPCRRSMLFRDSTRSSERETKRAARRWFFRVEPSSPSAASMRSCGYGSHRRSAEFRGSVEEGRGGRSAERRECRRVELRVTKICCKMIGSGTKAKIGGVVHGAGKSRALGRFCRALARVVSSPWLVDSASSCGKPISTSSAKASTAAWASGPSASIVSRVPCVAPNVNRSIMFRASTRRSSRINWIFDSN